MQKGVKPLEQTRTQLSRNHVKKRFSKNTGHKLIKQYAAFMALILIGIIIGSLCLRISGTSETQFSLTGIFMPDLINRSSTSKGFAALAVSAFSPAAVFICLAYVLGLCVVGFPFEFVIPVLFGAFVGGSMGLIYTTYSFKGFAICLLFVLPYALITALAVIVSSREGFRFSRRVAVIIVKGAQNDLSEAFRIYCFKFAFCFLFAAAASIIEALSVIAFSKLFFT